MAKLILNDDESLLIGGAYSIQKVILIGVMSGLLFWILTYVINKIIIRPIYCAGSAEPLTCLNSLTISGDMAVILTAVLDVFIMVKLKMAQPLIVAVSTAVALWGIAGWTNGLTAIETIIWAIVCYAIAFALFTWITRYDRVFVVLGAITTILVTVRIVAGL